MLSEPSDRDSQNVPPNHPIAHKKQLEVSPNQRLPSIGGVTRSSKEAHYSAAIKGTAEFRRATKADDELLPQEVVDEQLLPPIEQSTRHLRPESSASSCWSSDCEKDG